MDWKCTLLAAVYLLCLIYESEAQDEGAIHNAIFASYNPEVRPTYNHSVPTSVFIDFLPVQLSELNEKDQTLAVYGFFMYIWFDQFLTWNSTQYSGQQVITAHKSKHWAPELGIYNSVSTFYNSDNEAGIKSMIMNNGQISRLMAGEFRVTCTMSVRYFPFDKHKCHLRISSCSMSSAIIKLYPRVPNAPIALDLYNANGQWALAESSVTSGFMSPAAAEGATYEYLDFNFYLVRKNTYHMLNIVAPLIIIICLVPVLFVIPAEAGEKLGLGVTILLALSVFLLTLSDVTPTTSDNIPLITEFVTFQMVVTALAIICSVVVLRLHHCVSDKRPPATVRKVFFGFFAKILCVKFPQKEETNEDDIAWATKVPSPADSLSNLKSKAKADDEFTSMSAGNVRLLRYMDLMVKKMKDDEEANEISEEWQNLGVVIDWLLFWLFSILIFVYTLYTFVKGSASPAGYT